MQIAWLAVSLIGFAMMILTAVLLLRNTRGLTPWLMLLGAMGSLVSSASSQILSMTLVDWTKSGIEQLPMLLAAASTGFWLLYLAAVLMLAIQHRSLLSRLGELESILRDLSARQP